ncbi:hypothetical protein [Vulgatibacter incomptus]|uniref:LPP20 lipoprotein n=1 Tax=Vulgatibacter incomptus TaxID=1391653 RepID=A0A0K1PC67_9BACT|nr:hypothetical protein [Vulgatibacter incomptus]AKU91006.1 hypothetical protein AKJ08_1393 [Vulgatibacter incomptus]
MRLRLGQLAPGGAHVGGLLVVFGLVAACVGSPPALPKSLKSLAPEWSRVLVGVGEAESFEDARRQAVVSIASQLRADVVARDHVVAQASREERTGVTEGFERIVQEIRVDTRFDHPDWIETTEVTERGSRVRVVCTLDRLRAASRLDAEIEEDLMELRTELDRSRSQAAVVPLSRSVERMRASRKSLVEKLALLATLRRLPAERPRELAALAAEEVRLEALRAQTILRICLEPVGGSARGAERLSASFGASLASRGLRVDACSGDADAGHRLQGRLQTRVFELSQPGGFPYFCTTHLVFQLIDPGTGEVELGGVEQGRKAGGHSPREACHASMDLLAARVARALGSDAPAEAK